MLQLYVRRYLSRRDNDVGFRLINHERRCRVAPAPAQANRRRGHATLSHRYLEPPADGARRSAGRPLDVSSSRCGARRPAGTLHTNHCTVSSARTSARTLSPQTHPHSRLGDASTPCACNWFSPMPGVGMAQAAGHAHVTYLPLPSCPPPHPHPNPHPFPHPLSLSLSFLHHPADANLLSARLTAF